MDEIGCRRHRSYWAAEYRTAHQRKYAKIDADRLVNSKRTVADHCRHKSISGRVLIDDGTRKGALARRQATQTYCRRDIDHYTEFPATGSVNSTRNRLGRPAQLTALCSSLPAEFNHRRRSNLTASTKTAVLTAIIGPPESATHHSLERTRQDRLNS